MLHINESRDALSAGHCTNSSSMNEGGAGVRALEEQCCPSLQRSDMNPHVLLLEEWHAGATASLPCIQIDLLVHELLHMLPCAAAHSACSPLCRACCSHLL
jgi:hypothetical protein